MNVIRCKNGHFFDGDSYDKCPHCGESAMIGGSPAAPKEEKKSFWDRGKKDKKAAAPHINTTPFQAPERDFGTGDSPTDVIESKNFVASLPDPLKKSPTLDFWQTSSHSENGSDKTKSEQKELSAKLAESVVSTATYDHSANSYPEIKREEGREETREMASESSSSLKEAVRNASASNEGKTMSYFSAATSSSNQNQPRKSAEPVVGWLVCVGGCHFGECFSIYAGKNSIGRSVENRIVVADDNGISRIKHALIVYEPKKRNFFLQPGDSSGLTYLNDDYITESHKLSSYDMIELGESKFMFVPLCGEGFSWEDHMPKGE